MSMQSMVRSTRDDPFDHETCQGAALTRRLPLLLIKTRRRGDHGTAHAPAQGPLGPVCRMIALTSCGEYAVPAIGSNTACPTRRFTEAINIRPFAAMCTRAGGEVVTGN